MERCFPLLFESLDEQGALKELSKEVVVDNRDATQAIDDLNDEREESQASISFAPSASKKHTSVINKSERAAINRAVAGGSTTVPENTFDRARANIHKLITEGPLARFKNQMRSSVDLRKTSILSRLSAFLCCSS